MALFAASARRTKVAGVRFYEEEFRTLRRESRKRRVAVGVLIRQVVGEWIARQGRRGKRLAKSRR